MFNDVCFFLMVKSKGTGTGALAQRAQSSGYGSELTEFKECLDSALRWRVWVVLRGAKNWIQWFL